MSPPFFLPCDFADPQSGPQAFGVQLAAYKVLYEDFTFINTRCVKIAGIVISVLCEQKSGFARSVAGAVLTRSTTPDLFELTYRPAMRAQMLTHHFCVSACLLLPLDDRPCTTVHLQSIEAASRPIQLTCASSSDTIYHVLPHCLPPGDAKPFNFYKLFWLVVFKTRRRGTEPLSSPFRRSRRCAGSSRPQQSKEYLLDS